MSLGLDRLEKSVVLDGVVNGGGRPDRVESSGTGGGVVLVQDGFNDGFFRDVSGTARAVRCLDRISRILDRGVVT